MPSAEIGGQTSGKEGESAFEQGQADESERDQDQGPIERTGEWLGGAQDGVGEVAQQQVSGRFRQCRDAQREVRGSISQAGNLTSSATCRPVYFSSGPCGSQSRL